MLITRKLPWVELVEVDLGDNGDGDGVAGALPAEVMLNKLVVGGVESESRR